MMKWLNKRTSELGGLLVALIAADLIIGFFSRVAGQPILWVTEFAQFTMVAIIFLGQSLCEQNHGHVRVEVFIYRFPRPFWIAANLFTYLVALFAAGVLLWGAFMEAQFSYESKEAMSGLILIPLYPVKFVIVLGIGLYAIQVILNFIQEIRHPSPKPAGLDDEI